MVIVGALITDTNDGEPLRIQRTRAFIRSPFGRELGIYIGVFLMEIVNGVVGLFTILGTDAATRPHNSSVITGSII